mmetsp:Transcript_55220/g.171576  ORF Transcript_55220/g.171576 Transcript_55220/m.171576 type:complete len:271 (-) Transcript_55220:14-826(-)
MKWATAGRVTDALATAEPYVGIGIVRKEPNHFSKVSMAEGPRWQPLAELQGWLRRTTAAQQFGRLGMARGQCQQQRGGRAAALGIGGLVGRKLPVLRPWRSLAGTPEGPGRPGAVGEERGDLRAVAAGSRKHQRLVEPALLLEGQLPTHAGQLHLPAVRHTQRLANRLCWRDLHNPSAQDQLLSQRRHLPLLLHEGVHLLQRGADRERLEHDALACQVRDHHLHRASGRGRHVVIQTGVCFFGRRLPPITPRDPLAHGLKGKANMQARIR